VIRQRLSGTEEVLRIIAKRGSPKTYISLMSQYFPTHLAPDDRALCRLISAKDYARAQNALDLYGLTEGWVQGG